MSKYDSADVGFMLLGGYSLLGAVSKIEDTVELRLSETPVLGEVDEDYFSSGAKKTTLTQEGWFDDDTNSVHEALKELDDTALPLSIAPHGNIPGEMCDGYQSVQRVGYKVQLDVGEVHKANGEYGIWYGKVPCVILHELATESTAGNTDADDIALAGSNPATTNGGGLFVHVTELTGSPTSVTITFRHSTDGVTYADKQAAPAITPANVPANSGSYTAISGTINQYGSVAWAYSGGSGPTVTFAASVYVAPAS